MFSLFGSSRRSNRNKHQNQQKRRRQTLSRIGGFAAEALEQRNLLAGVTYVNDDWAFGYDVDQSGGLTAGDIVNAGPIQATYGSTGFGVVTGQGFVAGSETIASALNNTDIGGKVQVLGGTYTEDLTVDQAVTIQGLENPTLNATLAGVTLASTAGNVTLADFSISGGTTGLLLDGYMGSATLSNLALSGQSGSHTALVNGALLGQEVNASTVSFNGIAAGSATLAELYAIEDKIAHALDTASVGLVRVKAGNVYVTENTAGIQRGVDAATAGDIVNVAAGEFIENVSVNKAVSLQGAQFGVDGRSGRVGASETVVYSTVSHPSTSTAPFPAIFDVTADGVSIDGFTIDGDNPNLSSGFTLGGADIDAEEGVSSYSGVSGLTVRNNILQNLSYAAVALDQLGGDNLISQNLMHNLGGDGWGAGAIFSTNAYASVIDNKMTDVRLGVQTNNFHLANPGAPAAISNNEIDARRIGIFHNLAYQDASTFTISGNDITAIADAGDAVRWTGIWLSSLQNTVDAIVTNNNIDGTAATVPSTGYYSWNTPTSANLTVSGGSVTGVDIGVDVNNVDVSFGNATSSRLTVNGVTITAGEIGVRALDNPVNPFATATVTVALIDSSITTNGVGLGVSIDGNQASSSLTGTSIFNNTIGIQTTNGAAVTALSGNNFDGGASADNGIDIQLTSSAGAFTGGGNNTFAAETFFVENLSNSDVDLSAAGNDFEGLTSNFRIEDKMHHAVDTDLAVSGGLVTWVEDSIFITAPEVGSTDSVIQRGVDAADAGFTVNVEAGDYVDVQVILNKDITLSGANAGNSAKGGFNRDARVSETRLSASVTGALSGITVTAAGAGATIDGIELFGAGRQSSEYAQIVVLAPNVTIRNSILNSNLENGFQPTTPFPAGTAFGLILGFGVNYDGLLVQDSFFARSRAGVFANPGSGTNTITFDSNEFITRTGINHDIGFSQLNSTINNNLIGQGTVDGYTFGAATGVNVGLVPNGGSVAFTNNEVASNFIGLDLKNVAAGGSVVIEGNDFSDYATPAVGVRVTAAIGATVTFTDNTFSNLGVFVANTGALSVDLTDGNLANLGGGPIDIATASLTDAFAIADKVIDAVDVPGVGHVRLQTGKVFVTPGSFAAPTTTSASIQRGVDAATAGDTVHVAAGTFIGNTTVNKAVSLVGAGIDQTIASGPVGGNGATIRFASPGILLEGFTVTREGNNTTDWDSALNLTGVAIQGVAASGSEIRNNKFFGNRTAIDINLSHGHLIHNNVIDSNRSGIIIRNDAQNNIITENDITNNFTVGVLWLPGIGDSATGTEISFNNISGNWYAQIENRTTQGGVKNFSSNWFGTADLTFANTNGSEPGYSPLIPTIFGGTSTPPAPGTVPTIRGAGLADIDYSPWLGSGVDTDLLAVGFQSGFNILHVDDDSAATGGAAYIDEAFNLLADGGSLVVHDGHYAEDVDFSSKAVSLELGVGAAAVEIDGALTLSDDDSLLLDIGATPGAAGDVLSVTGQGLFGNATLELSSLDTFLPGGVFTLINRGSGNDIFGNVAEGQQITIDTQSATARYTLGDGNDFGVVAFSNPIIGNAGGVLNYTEHDPAINLAPAATLVDGDTPVFNGGELWVDFLSANGPGDLFVVRNTGSGAGQIGVVGSDVQFGGVTFGTFAGGTNGDPLVISFTNDGNATLAAVQALIRAITYRNTGDNPLSGLRDVLFLVQDGTGGTGAVIKQLNVIGVNDAPTLTPANSNFNYVNNASNAPIGQPLTVTDPEANFNGGKLEVNITSGLHSSNRVYLFQSGPFTITGTDLKHNGITIGTISDAVFGNGFSRNKLTVTFNGNATLSLVQQTIARINFRTNTADVGVSNATRTIELKLSDATGDFAISTANVNVSTVNTAPTLPRTGSDTFSYANNALFAGIGQGLTANDLEGNFTGGKLEVTVTSGADSSSNRVHLALPTPFTIVGTDLKHSGITIGTIGNAIFGNGYGRDAISVTFNASATLSHVQQVTQAIRFRTNTGSGTSTTQRVIEFKLTDGDGAVVTSNAIVNVT